uniref:uncharacterized protein LOC132669740 n=1 Tax=Panthera onca TaxID=9690 RepID=UPI002955AB15|nr:uncharacterized protein LOC132669740 [Panthera onca]
MAIWTRKRGSARFLDRAPDLEQLPNRLHQRFQPVGAEQQKKRSKSQRKQVAEIGQDLHRPSPQRRASNGRPGPHCALPPAGKTVGYACTREFHCHREIFTYYLPGTTAETTAGAGDKHGALPTERAGCKRAGPEYVDGQFSWEHVWLLQDPPRPRCLQTSP